MNGRDPTVNSRGGVMKEKYISKNLEKRRLLRDFQNGNIDRRTFLTRLAAAASLTMLPPALFRCSSGDARNDEVFSQERWDILKLVQNHLFPSDSDSPGAKEINAAVYLQNVLLDPQIDPEDKEFILNGLDWTEETANELLNKSILKMNKDEIEKVLRNMAEYQWGENWLSQILIYIFEALLTDPIYGGNPDGIGWKWLGHDPGLPRPTEKNRYGVI